MQAREEKERKRREAAAVERQRREADAAAEQRTIDGIKLASRAWLKRLFPAGMSIRQGLKSLNVVVGAGPDGERAALRRARILSPRCSPAAQRSAGRSGEVRRDIQGACIAELTCARRRSEPCLVYVPCHGWFAGLVQ